MGPSHFEVGAIFSSSPAAGWAASRARKRSYSSAVRGVSSGTGGVSLTTTTVPQSPSRSQRPAVVPYTRVADRSPCQVAHRSALFPDGAVVPGGRGDALDQDGRPTRERDHEVAPPIRSGLPKRSVVHVQIPLSRPGSRRQPDPDGFPPRPGRRRPAVQPPAFLGTQPPPVRQDVNRRFRAATACR